MHLTDLEQAGQIKLENNYASIPLNTLIFKYTKINSKLLGKEIM